jgi:hypothetical protein
MKKIFAAVITILPGILMAQKYNALLIPDSLKKNANVVERYDETRIEIKEAGKAKIYQKHAYTILNEAGDVYANYVSGYDKFNDINYIDGTLYDANGKELKNVRKKDISDESGTGDESLITDIRYKVHNFYYRSYPYTVEYEEEDEMNGVYQLPKWQPQGKNTHSVEYSKFIVTTPKNLPIRYRAYNFTGNPVITENNGLLTYTWEIKNIPARTGESLQPPWKEIWPIVMIAPTDFELQGYKGSMSTWGDLGVFGYTLMQGRDVLPGAIKQKVHELTDNVTDSHEKTKILYQFLQQNTRYISIQLGIGGLQPFDASYVATKRYGDCKALSNYMVALLKEAGIKANCVWIRGGNEPGDIITDFSCDQFNHVIACVPLNNDTLWLECTDQNIPAGYIGAFTANRHGLMIDEKGGHLVSTIKYNADDNKQVRNIAAIIDETGKLTADVQTRYSCLQQDELAGMINYLTKDKQLEELKKNIDLPDYDILQFNYDQTKTEKPFIDEQLKLVANNYASVSGKRLFVMPNVLSKNSIKLSATEERKYDIDYPYSFIDIDTATITIPVGYTIEAMPKDISINNKFASYEIHFNVNGEKINFTRLYKRSEGRFPPGDYAALVKFYDDMYKADRSRIVFVKKDN